MDRGRRAAGRDAPQLGRGRVVVVARDHVARRGPLRGVPDAAGRELGRAAVRRVDRDEREAVALPARRHDAAAVGMPGVLGVVRARARELAVVRAVRVHQVQLVEAAPLRRVRDRSAVGRPPRAAVVHVGHAGEPPDRAGLDARHADLAAAVLVGARGERVRDLGAVRRHVGVALVAVRVEVAVPGGEAARPRVVHVDDRQPGRPVLVALHVDQQAVVVDPERAAALDQPSRRAARGRDQPHVVPVRVGDGAPVRREPRRRVLPVRHRVAAGGEAPRRAAVLEVEQPHVGAVVAVLDEHRAAAVAAHRQAARPRRVGDRLEPPVRRARSVRAAAARARRGARPCRPRSSRPHPRPRAPSSIPVSASSTSPPSVSRS